MPQTSVDVTSLVPSQVILYRLPLKLMPTHPEKLWRGRIVYVFLSAKAVMVESLEEGFEGCQELVDFCQIMSVEGRQDQ